MALLTRSRRSRDPAAEALDRAREVSEQVADRAREVSEDARERAGEVADRAREATEPRLARAREAAEPAVARAREASRPALAQLSTGFGAVLRLLVRLVAVLPTVGASVLEGVARGLGQLADRSAEIAHVEPPSRTGRRRSRRRAALWFTGGFAAGAATGYAVCELTRADRDHQHQDDEPWHPTAVPDTPTASPVEG